MPWILTPEDRKKAHAFMSDPGEWPRWPKLPLKRQNPETGMLQVGILMALEGHLTRVVLISMFEKIENDEDFLSKDHIVYDDVDAILDDGWVVD